MDMNALFFDWSWMWTKKSAVALFVDPWTAKSRTCEAGRDKTWWYCLVYPLTAKLYLSAVPVLWPVVIGLSTVYSANVLRTFTVEPAQLNRNKDTVDVSFIAYRRRYDETLKRPISVVLEVPADKDYALSVVGTIRQRYVKDKSDPTNEYYVMDQFHLKPKLSAFGPEIHITRITYDAIATVGVISIAWTYRAASKLFIQDLKLVLEGRLSLLSIRTPLFSWFRNPAVVQRENLRIVFSQKKKPLKYPIKPDLSGKKNP